MYKGTKTFRDDLESPVCKWEDSIECKIKDTGLNWMNPEHENDRDAL